MQRRGCEELHQLVVRNANGQPLGWFAYCANRGGVGQVVQIATRKGAYVRVLNQLFAHARAHGMTAIAGRMDPATAQDLADAGCTFTRDGPWMCVNARHPEVARAIEEGDAFLSRLEGEWWLSF